MCCPRTLILSSPVFLFGALSDRLSRSMGSGGCVAFADCLNVFPLAVVHLVLVHGWVVLLVGPLVPGVQPRDADTLVTFSFLFSVGRFSPFGGLMLGYGCLLHFHILFAALGLGVLLSFFSQASFVSFSRSLDARMRRHSHAHLLARTLFLSLAGAHVPACPHGFSLWFPRSSPPPCLLPSSLPSRSCCWPVVGVGGDSTPSVGCGCAAPGAFVFVCVVRFGWVGLGVSCALFSSPLVWQMIG